MFVVLFVLLIDNVLCLPANLEETKSESKQPSKGLNLLTGSEEEGEDDDYDDQEEEPENCLICRDEFLPCQPPVDLICGHKYHADCLVEWQLLRNDFSTSSQCFMCKKDLVVRAENGLHLTDIYYYAKLREIARNKLKMGVQSSRLELPTCWESFPEDLSEGESIY